VKKGSNIQAVITMTGPELASRLPKNEIRGLSWLADKLVTSNDVFWSYTHSDIRAYQGSVKVTLDVRKTLDQRVRNGSDSLVIVVQPGQRDVCMELNDSDYPIADGMVSFIEIIESGGDQMPENLKRAIIVSEPHAEALGWVNPTSDDGDDEEEGDEDEDESGVIGDE